MNPQNVDPTVAAEVLPDHTQLPDRDGAIVVNDQEHPQSDLLSGCLWPRLEQLYGERFTVGCDHGIYWRYTKPPLKGCKAPDWYLVAGVPRMLNGEVRRSYVLWNEGIKPLVVIEYVSGDGSEEHDQTPEEGKFWVYEQAINASYYIIFDRFKSEFEVYHLDSPTYVRLSPNSGGRVAIPQLGIEFGLWEGRFRTLDTVWLRVWDSATGLMLPTEGEDRQAQRERAEAAEALVDDANRMREEETERAETERKNAEKATRVADKERQNAEEERKRAEKADDLAEVERKRAEKADERTRKLAERLRQLGVDPDAA